MSKLNIIKQKLLALVLTLGIIATAVGFSYFLGKYYLDNVVKSYPVTQPVYTKVYYSVTIKKVRLQPVSVYSLQAGVFTDMKGAADFARSLSSNGLRPYITVNPPYKVLVFAAPSREKLDAFKAYVPAEAFVVNNIFNNEDIEVRSDREFWLSFLPQFADLFIQTLNVISEGGNTKDKELSIAWNAMAEKLEEQARQEASIAETINKLAQDCKEMAGFLQNSRTTIQGQGEIAQVVLKTKFDYDNLIQFLAKFD